MSKFLLNLLLQISKALVYLKIKFLFRNEFSFTFGPIGPAASRPIRPFGPAMAHLFFFNRPLPLSPLGLGLLASPARPLGPADRASLAPCPIAAAHSKSVNFRNHLHLTSSHHRNTATTAASLALLRPGRLVLLT
jgi:hypothetical protein